jgi:hypothetical protein
VSRSSAPAADQNAGSRAGLPLTVRTAAVWFATTLSAYEFSSLPRQGAYANTRGLDNQQIAGELARVDTNDICHQLSFRRIRHAIEFKQDYTTNLQPLTNDQFAKITILRDEDAVIAIGRIQDVFI